MGSITKNSNKWNVIYFYGTKRLQINNIIILFLMSNSNTTQNFRDLNGSTQYGHEPNKLWHKTINSCEFVSGYRVMPKMISPIICRYKIHVNFYVIRAFTIEEPIERLSDRPSIAEKGPIIGHSSPPPNSCWNGHGRWSAVDRPLLWGYGRSSGILLHFFWNFAEEYKMREGEIRWRGRRNVGGIRVISTVICTPSVPRKMTPYLCGTRFYVSLFCVLSGEMKVGERK